MRATGGRPCGQMSRAMPLWSRRGLGMPPCQDRQQPHPSAWQCRRAWACPSPCRLERCPHSSSASAHGPPSWRRCRSPSRCSRRSLWPGPCNLARQSRHWAACRRRPARRQWQSPRLAARTGTRLASAPRWCCGTCPSITGGRCSFGCSTRRGLRANTISCTCRWTSRPGLGLGTPLSTWSGPLRWQDSGASLTASRSGRSRAPRSARSAGACHSRA
mmetsp:Transcript_16119/g.43823  ORF Transcript_16119/g.43823 Transcript_16119/m.43823 type:complete len:217 (+) Transcript_16119:603-1253(+)